MNSYASSGSGSYRFVILKNEEEILGDSWIEPPVAPKWLFSERYYDLGNPQELMDVLGWDKDNVDSVLEVGVLPIGRAVYARKTEKQEITSHGRGRPVIEKTSTLKRTVGDVYRLFIKVKDPENAGSK